jgi:hypothetical protein
MVDATKLSVAPILTQDLLDFKSTMIAKINRSGARRYWSKPSVSPLAAIYHMQEILPI